MITRSKLLTAGLTLAMSILPASAQDLITKAPKQDAPIFLVGGTVHTVSGDTLEDAVVGFNNGRITVVGPRAILDVIQLTPDSKLIDIEGQHVYPGLIAASTILGLTEHNAVRATNDYAETGSITPEVTPAVAVNPDSTLIPVARLNGVLTAGVTPTGGRVPGRLSIIRLDGWTNTDMTIDPHAGLMINWPSVRPSQNWWNEANPGKQREDARKALDAIDALFADATTYAAERASDPSRSTDLRLDAMASVLPGAGDDTNADQDPLFISANDAEQITSAVTWAISRGLKPVIVGGQDALLCADLLTTHDVPVIIAGTYRFPSRNDAAYDDAFTFPARLHEAGIRFANAGADRDGNIRNIGFEAGTSAAHGLSDAQAIRSITLSAAEILGIDDQLGSIETGKAATLIVTTGSPLEITTHVKHAFIDGREIPLVSKQTELANKYRTKYRQLGIVEDNPDENKDDPKD